MMPPWGWALVAGAAAVAVAEDDMVIVLYSDSAGITNCSFVSRSVRAEEAQT